jgi:hypothetical protein
MRPDSEQKEKLLRLRMARRPEFLANLMTREQLKQLRWSLSLLSPHTVRNNYEETLQKCRLPGAARRLRASFKNS